MKIDCNVLDQATLADWSTSHDAQQMHNHDTWINMVVIHTGDEHSQQSINDTIVYWHLQ